MHLRTETLIDLALDEDAGLGDVTSEAIFPADHVSWATISSKEDLVICGLDVAAQVFKRVDSSLEVTLACSDGARVSPGTRVLAANGSTISLLIAERTALNFLQRLSGIATQSNRYAEAAARAGTGVRVVDTRKTTPGWRALEKYAVRCGGCFNHRGSLSEHVLIKDNHIAAAGSIARAVSLSRARAAHSAKIEVEVESMSQIRDALEAGAEIIMLDNMQPDEIREAVSLIQGAAMVEVSGGVELDTLIEYAQPGVDVISVGALTHSVTAADLSMSIAGVERR